MKKLRLFKTATMLIVIGALNFLIGCNNNISGGSAANGTLSFNKSSLIVANGSASELILTLANSAGITGLNVKIASSNTSIAQVSPTECNLSSKPGTPQSCEIIVSGAANGNAAITATATGYTAAPVAVNVSNAIIKGNLAFDVNAESVTVNSTNYVRLSLNDSTGVSSLPVTIASTNAAVASVSPAGCTLSSGMHRSCEITITGNSTGNTNITAAAAGYTVAPVVAAVGNNPVPGAISFNNTAATVSPQGTSNMVLSLNKSSGVSGLGVTLTSSNPAIVTVSPSSCTLSSDPILRHCSVTITGVATGSAAINATANSTVNGYTYNIVPVSVTVAAVAGRTITFVNKCSNPVWFGASPANPNAFNPDGTQSTSAFCGESAAPGVYCPNGSSCINTNPPSVAPGAYKCTYNNYAPTNGTYVLNQGDSNFITIPNTAYEPKTDILWDSLIVGRQNCAADGTCEISNCYTVNGGTNMQCRAGQAVPTNKSPSTRFEITLQKQSNDSYNISLINGATVAISASPTNAPASVQSPYFCETAGSTTTQGSVPASSWQFTPPNDYYNWVETKTTPTNCTLGGNECTVAGEVCGFTVENISQPLPSTPYQLTCGKRLGYWTAEQIWVANPNTTTNNLAYFAFGTNGATYGYPNYEVMACTGTATLSGWTSPAQPANEVCGCTTWPTLPVFTPSGYNCNSNNQDWQSASYPKLIWLKQACPTCYAYAYDDPSSLYNCHVGTQNDPQDNIANYTVTFCPNN